MTRRTAITVLLVAAGVGAAKEVETGTSESLRDSKLLTTGFEPMMPPKLTIQFSLDNMEGIAVTKGSKSVLITPDEIWKALQKEKP